MSLIAVENLSLSFAGRTLFDHVGFAVSAQDRVGLVGRNGMGKTSLLRCVVGELAPDDGQIRVARGARIGYLQQEISAPRELPLLSSVLQSVPGLGLVEQEIAVVEEELERTEDEASQQELALRLSELLHRRENYQTCYAPHEAERILAGLGFAPARFEQSLATLSGGWRMRAALASLLFQQPDVLLLDEPTNHLDLPSVEWFDGYLKKYPGACVLVSHDKAFLNSQIARVISLELEGLRSYSGNYDQYVALRDDEDVLLKNRARNLERERKEIERFVERFKAKATHARQASSRAKVLHKMEKVQTLALPKELSFRFKPAVASGRQVVAVEGLTKRFGEQVLYQDLDLRVYRGERVAVVGANGTGKTTLLRIIAQDLDADAGSVSFGHQVQFDYYAQHCADGLHPALNVLQTLWSDLPAESQTAVRGLLGAFLFSGDDALKPVGVLSGGERARVALARLVARPTNLLIMDEPTNHLDLNASEALAEAMQAYEGSVIFVSHNISLLRAVATKIWDIRDGQVHEVLGGYDDYLRARERDQQAARDKNPRRGAPREEAPAEPAPASKGNRSDEKAKKRAEAEHRQQLARKLGDLPRRIAELEKRIAALEDRLAALEAELARADVYQDQSRYPELLREFTEGKSKLDELMGRWEHLEEERARIAGPLE
ncbi:MAG: ABC-F family ATP-binding cassette domain-containing protein [Pseudomonadota bacterium]